MKPSSLSRLPDDAVLLEIDSFQTKDLINTAGFLAYIGEADARRLYLPKGFSSMHLYCVHKVGMPEDIAYRRVRAARAARRYPAILDGLMDGRLHLTGVVLLARHLTRANANELLTAAAHKTKAEIELLIAQRFPQSDMPTMVRALSATAAAPRAELAMPSTLQLAPVPILFGDTQPTNEHIAPQPASESIHLGPSVEAPVPAYTRLAPRSPGRFALQVTVDQATHDQLRYAQALLGHAVPTGDVAAVLKRALDAYVEKLERQKFAKCARSRPQRGAPKGRYVPAEVRRSVWQRDDGRCTFVSDSGKRCDARERLEFDHADPVAKGGHATTSNLRLRCRAHNQYAAECAFGSGFMHEKRQEARARADQVSGRAGAAAAPWLRPHGFSAEDARRGVARCVEAIGDQ